jgi:hypothetical protein
VEKDADKWEKVVRKLRAGMMPPAGMPRPAAATYESVVSFLENALDKSLQRNFRRQAFIASTGPNTPMQFAISWRSILIPRSICRLTIPRVASTILRARYRSLRRWSKDTRLRLKRSAGWRWGM